jgi:hypothetical protein
MEPQPITAAIDDFEEELIQMNITGSTQEELLTWLDKHGVTVSRRTLVRRLKMTAYLELIEKKLHLPSTVRFSHSINACYPLSLRELPRLTNGGSPRLYHGPSAKKRIG